MSHKKETVLLFFEDFTWNALDEAIKNQLKKKKKIWSACKATDKQIKIKIVPFQLWEILQNDTVELHLQESKLSFHCQVISANVVPLGYSWNMPKISL